MTYFISFLEGIITFVSPCLLPMLPVYISYFAGGGEGGGRPRSLGNGGAIRPEEGDADGGGLRRLGFVEKFCDDFDGGFALCDLGRGQGLPMAGDSHGCRKL